MAVGFKKAASIFLISLVLIIILRGLVFGEDALYNKATEAPEPTLEDIERNLKEPKGTFLQADEIDEKMEISFNKFLRIFEEDVTGNRCLHKIDMPDFDDWRLIFSYEGDQSLVELQNNKKQTIISPKPLAKDICLMVEFEGDYSYLTQSNFILSKNKIEFTDQKAIENLEKNHNLEIDNFVLNRDGALCFILDCDQSCMKDFLSNNIEFCGEAFTDVFYQNTYYGDRDDWRTVERLGEDEWKYFGNDKKVPYKYTQFSTGIYDTTFNQVFNFQNIDDKDHKSHDDPGVWFDYKGELNYYDEEDNWCFKPAGIVLWFIPNPFDGPRWVYTGTEERVKEQILIEEKFFVFGGLREDTNKICNA